MDWVPSVIVAAIDGSAQSERAVAAAATLARVHRARLVLMTVVRPPEGWWGVTGEPPTPEALSEALVSGQQEVLSSVEHHVDLSGITYTTVEELGDPTSTILAVCEREKADLLVVGRRGAGLVERMVIGSVADRLAHHAPCPLLIVP
ncbi:MAG TPA: universal stress protein [Acidimicrobiia bacterium]|jgi:nucleotide-binding universal stress UspA family protein|nr:universal stress protein [Acidimicrobiia bacterium]